MRKLVVRFFLVLFFVGLIYLNFGGIFMTFHLTTSAFQNEGVIPAKYTADGQDVSPALKWSDAPLGTKSFVLIMDDPDAPAGTWVHWVVYDIPESVKELPEAVPATEILSNGAKQGLSSFRAIGFGGPSPPPGKPHRYFFKLYALDTMLKLQPGKTKQEVEKAMQGHVLAEAIFMGKYGR
jgi:Raf kinase inhibitor-like YbhB/YbcL family protein